MPDHITLTLRPSVTEASWSEIEAFGADVKSELEARPHPACLVNLQPLNYMGSSIVALIVRIWKVVQTRQGKMVVVATDPTVLEVIRLAGLDKVWKIAHDQGTGRDMLGVRPGQDPVLSLPEVTAATRKASIWSFVFGIVTVLVALVVAWVIVSNR